MRQMKSVFTIVLLIQHHLSLFVCYSFKGVENNKKKKETNYMQLKQ